MGFATFNGGQVVNPTGQQEYLFLVRSDTNEIDFIDYTQPPNYSVVTRVFTLGEDSRGTDRRPRRITVFGQGTVSAGSTITIATDQVRGEVYPCSPGDPNKQELVVQECRALVGELIAVTLFLMGSNIIVSNIKMEYVPVGG